MEVPLSTRSPSWAFLEGFQIRQNGSPYLDRLRLLQTPMFGVYLHRIHTPDSDRDPHDHPWAFASLVLSGGYEELLYTDQAMSSMGTFRSFRRWSMHWMSRSVAHKITDVRANTWTLVITGPRHNDWGFWTKKGKVGWRDYHTEVY